MEIESTNGKSDMSRLSKEGEQECETMKCTGCKKNLKKLDVLQYGVDVHYEAKEAIEELINFVSTCDPPKVVWDASVFLAKYLRRIE